MANEMQIFKSEVFGTVRGFEIEGEPWLVGKDVAELLGYSNPRDALSKHVDEEDKGVAKCDTLGGGQNLTIINESGLYALVFGSKLTGAKAFKRWVTSEVLPAIRKHGGYLTPKLADAAVLDPDLIIRLATNLKKEREEKERLRAAREADHPKVLFADAVAASGNTILIGELAKILKQNGIDIGQQRLFGFLRDKGVLIRREGTDKNMPTQKAMEMGLFKIKETAVTHSDGHVTVSKTVKVTGKGQQYIINKFLSGQWEL